MRMLSPITFSLFSVLCNTLSLSPFPCFSLHLYFSVFLSPHLSLCPIPSLSRGTLCIYLVAHTYTTVCSTESLPLHKTPRGATAAVNPSRPSDRDGEAREKKLPIEGFKSLMCCNSNAEPCAPATCVKTIRNSRGTQERRERCKRRRGEAGKGREYKSTE